MINENVDKQNGTCLYNDALHAYWDKEDGGKYTSVTTLIHKFCQPFDAEFWSSYKALQKLMGDGFSQVQQKLLMSKRFDMRYISQYNIDPFEFDTAKKDILLEWEINKNNSCERGTAIHLEKELNFYDGDFDQFKKFGITSDYHCERNYYELDKEKGVYPEYLVSRKSEDGLLRIAGQIDLLIKDGNDIHIYDWKTNKKLDQKSYFDSKTKKYQMMKFPLNNVMDCNMMHYTMQLSTYAYLLQLINPEFNIKTLMIIHYDHDGKETQYSLEYKKQEVEAMLKFYKKQSILEERKESRKPINY